MNREQLEQLVLTEVIVIDTEVDNPNDVVERLADKLWPVLAQVWADGYEVGWDDRTLVRDGHLTKATASNPYSEASQPVT